MTDILTFPVESGVQGTIELRTVSVKFGEGYQQDWGDGMNVPEDTWPVSAAGPVTDLQFLIDFLEAHAGYISFYWTPPHRTQGRYLCKQYQVTNLHGDEVRVTATFKRAYRP